MLILLIFQKELAMSEHQTLYFPVRFITGVPQAFPGMTYLKGICATSVVI